MPNRSKAAGFALASLAKKLLTRPKIAKRPALAEEVIILATKPLCDRLSPLHLITLLMAAALAKSQPLVKIKPSPHRV